jgi:signal transduction histidine kinase/CheY-like chemotaxis protein
MREKLAALAGGHLDEAALQTLIKFQDEAAQRVAEAPKLSALESSDREDDLSDWLDEHGVTHAYEIASSFVAAGLDAEWLDQVANAAPPESLAGAIHWLYYTVDTELLMKEITDSTTRISTLVGAAKQYSQIDRSPHQNADLHELLDSTLVMLGRKIPPGVTVVKEYDADLPLVPAYAAELNQVWTNLIDNAVQAMGETGTLTVGTRRDDEFATVTVHDTGPGIPADVKDRVFEPFFTTKPVGKGTGLGLSQIFAFVRQQDGEIAIDSAPGEGTTVRLRLPRDASVATIAAAGEVAAVAQVAAASLVILVVEDDPRVLAATVGALEELGHQAIACDDPLAAPDLLDRHPAIELIVSDVLMPVRTGPEMIAALDPRHAHLAVLFVTGFAGEAGEFGGHHVLRKPFTLIALEQAVAAAMMRKRPDAPQRIAAE